MTTERDIMIDELAEDVFPEFDEAVDSVSEMLMEEEGINSEVMIDLIHAWLLKRAKQTGEWEESN